MCYKERRAVISLLLDYFIRRYGFLVISSSMYERVSMKNDFSLSIPTPCSADWNTMTPNEQVKFCGQCSLTVVDFTRMTDTEIKKYFTCHQGQKTCGRFTTVQLAGKDSGSKFFWTKLIKNGSGIRAVLLNFLTALAFLSSCNRSASVPHLMGDVEVMGQTAVEQIDTTNLLPPPLDTLK